MYARVEHVVVREVVSALPHGPAAFLETFHDVAGVSPQPAVGWRLDGKAFSPPVAASLVPQQVTAFQLRAALHALPGKAAPATLLDDVNGHINVASLGSPVTYLAWEYASTVTRHGVLVSSVAAGLGLTSEQVDALFTSAAKIVA